MLFFSKNLKDPKHRKTVISQAVEEARQEYRRVPPEQAREPILKLQDHFDEVGLDRLEILMVADSSIPGDLFWLNQIVQVLVNRQGLSENEVSYLLRLALINPERLELWGKVFQALEQQATFSAYLSAREQCALALLPWFGPRAQKQWADVLTERNAKVLMGKCLEEVADQILMDERTDQRAQTILKAVITREPHRLEFKEQLAQIVVRSNEAPSPENIGLVLEVVLNNPEKKNLKLWAARALLDIPGHFAEGLNLLRQLYADFPSEEIIGNEYIEALGQAEEILDSDLQFLRLYYQKNPKDQRAIELLAEEYSRQEVLTDEALQLYRDAASFSSHRHKFLRLIGKQAASQSRWSDVIEVFDEVIQSGENHLDIIIPLATAYAEFDRQDANAIDVYHQALAQGSRNVSIHNIVCRQFYLTARPNPESVRQYMQSAKDCPDCMWAQLGMISHYLDTGDGGRALEGACRILRNTPGDLEAQRLAGKALAKDFSRRQLAKLAHLEGKVLRAVFEAAYKEVPDAGPIVLGVVRRRLADGDRDEETAKLLGDVCRKNPDAMDLRVARADLLWDLDENVNAVELYRDLAERVRTVSPDRLPSAITAPVRKRIFARIAEWLLRPPGPAVDDIDNLIEACADPDVSPEVLLGTVRHMVDFDFEHDKKQVMIEQALAYAPGDVKLQRALAQCYAAKGDREKVLTHVIDLIRNGHGDESLALLVRSLVSSEGEGPVSRQKLNLLRGVLDPVNHPSSLLLAVSDLVESVGDESPVDMAILEKLVRVYPKNGRIQRRYARCLADTGDDQRASGVYSAMVDEGSQDREVVIELARTNARLGAHLPKHRTIARKAVEFSPDDAQLVFHQACIELEIGNVVTAVRLLNRVVELDEAYHSRVMQLVEGSSKMRTEHGELFMLLARVHLKAGRIEQALALMGRLQVDYQRYLGDLIDLYGEIVEVDPENPRPLMERAILRRLGGMLEDALKDMQKAQELSPGNSDIKGEYADTLRQKVLLENAQNVERAVYCAELLYDLDDEESAYEIVEKILEKNQDDRVWVLKARLQLSANAPSASWGSLKQVKEKADYLPLYQELARSFAENEQHREAADVMTEAIEIGGPQKGLLEQLRNLYKTEAKSDETATYRRKTQEQLSPRAQGRYELREKLGSGSMGDVYKAYDRELDEVVCLKILPDQFSTDQEAISRFRNEAKAARKLTHPHICRIHDIGEEEGRRYISMEYIPEGNLRSYLKKLGGGGLRVDRAISIIKQVARGLNHAHQEGVLHCDIKSSNILVAGEERMKLSDFGIASLVENSQHQTLKDTGSYVLGTPLYMSPEQFDGIAPTEASDIYSLGILFYELLSGTPPFLRGSIPYHHRFTNANPIEGVPQTLWKVVSRMLEKNPSTRYQSVIEFLNCLDEAIG